MRSRSMALLLIVALINLNLACTRTVEKTVVRPDVPALTTEKVLWVTLRDGGTVMFDDEGGRYVPKGASGMITGRTREGRLAEVAEEEIVEVRMRTEEHDATGTIVAVLAVPTVAAAALVVYFIANPPHSCPFIYSHDGEQWVFDAQTYGGAVTRGLKRTDYSRLDHLRPVDGSYRLMMRNDPVDETQYTDEVKLLVVDHPAGTIAAPGYDGAIRVLPAIQAPLAVVDEKGTDLRPFFAARDEVRWQSTMPTDTSFRSDNPRHHLTFTFPKPKGARSARLYINAGTSFWGAAMIGRFLRLHGNAIDSWYQGVDRDRRGPEMKEVWTIMEGEELYHMKLKVLEGAHWADGGIVRTGGAMADEDRVMELDLSRVEGDSVTLRLDPPRGFWKIDHLGLAYDSLPAPAVTELAARAGTDMGGEEVVSLLAANDERYHTLEKEGDWATLEFAVPPQAPGTVRSIFLKTSGFYRVHFPQDGPEQKETLRTILTVPGAANRYALDEYLKWRAGYATHAEARR